MMNILNTVIAEKFKVDSMLGSGGMGSVYRAHQSDLNRTVAIKVLHGSNLTDPDSIARFEREAQVLSAVRHPNIVGIYSYGVLTSGSPYMVMEYVEGKTLNETLSESGRLAPERAANIIIQVANALEAAHTGGVIHRDIKPQNIMLLSGKTDDYVKVLDFGLSKLLSEAAQEAIQKLTQTGALVGSVQYMSPEACSGAAVDARSDIYSLGCVLYECLSGKPPFECDNPVGMLHKHRMETAPPFDRSLKLPELLEKIVLKAIAKSPGDRFASMNELSTALEHFKSGSPIEIDLPHDSQKRDRMPAMTLKLAAAAVVLVTIGALATGQKRTLENYITTAILGLKADAAIGPCVFLANNCFLTSRPDLAASIYNNLLEREAVSKDRALYADLSLKSAALLLDRGNGHDFFKSIDQALRSNGESAEVRTRCLNLQNEWSKTRSTSGAELNSRALCLSLATKAKARAETRETLRMLSARLPLNSSDHLRTGELDNAFDSIINAFKIGRTSLAKHDLFDLMSQVGSSISLFPDSKRRMGLLEELLKIAPDDLKVRLRIIQIAHMSRIDSKAGARLATGFLNTAAPNEREYLLPEVANAVFQAQRFSEALALLTELRKTRGPTIQSLELELTIYQKLKDEKKLRQVCQEILTIIETAPGSADSAVKILVSKVSSKISTIDTTKKSMELEGIASRLASLGQVEMAARLYRRIGEFLRTYDFILEPPVAQHMALERYEALRSDDLYRSINDVLALLPPQQYPRLSGQLAWARAQKFLDGKQFDRAIEEANAGACDKSLILRDQLMLVRIKALALHGKGETKQCTLLLKEALCPLVGQATSIFVGDPIYLRDAFNIIIWTCLETENSDLLPDFVDDYGGWLTCNHKSVGKLFIAKILPALKSSRVFPATKARILALEPHFKK